MTTEIPSDREAAAEAASDLIATCVWHGAFLQELVAQSPSYYLRDSRATVAAEHPAIVFLRVTLVEQPVQGLEFKLIGVTEVAVSFQHDLRPAITCSRDEVILDLGPAGAIRANRIEAATLSARESTYESRYCRRQFFDPTGVPKNEEI